MPAQPNKGKKVWIKCRVKIDGLPDFKCTGTQAILMAVRKPAGSAGTKVAKYKCLTCNRTFTVST